MSWIDDLSVKCAVVLHQLSVCLKQTSPGRLAWEVLTSRSWNLFVLPFGDSGEKCLTVTPKLKNEWCVCLNVPASYTVSENVTRTRNPKHLLKIQKRKFRCTQGTTEIRGRKRMKIRFPQREWRYWDPLNKINLMLTMDATQVKHLMRRTEQYDGVVFLRERMALEGANCKLLKIKNLCVVNRTLTADM